MQSPLYPPALSLSHRLLLHLAWPPYGPHPQHPSPSSPFSPCPVIPGLSISGPGEQWGSCVCRLFPTITFNYGSLQCGLVKGLAIRSLSLSLTLFPPRSILESGQAPCENDPNSPLLTLHAPQLTLREPAPTREPHRHSVNSHLSLPLFIFYISLLSPPPSSTWSPLLLLLLLPSSQSSLFFPRVLHLHRDLILFAVVGEFRGNRGQWIP